MRQESRDGSEAELARLVRGTHVLEPALKRHWLSVLPYLTEADRVRLRQILEAGSSIGGASATPADPVSGRGGRPRRRA
jgi:hypothetical protein